MSQTQLSDVLAELPAVSILLWVVSAIALLYLARLPAHRSIRSSCKVFRRVLRIASKLFLLAEQGLLSRNREILFSAAGENVERATEKEFDRLNAVVTGDLSSYPVLQRKLMDQIERMDEDYRANSDLPPPPPTWLTAVEGLSRVPIENNRMAGELFAALQKCISKQFKEAIKEYRKGVSVRHELLKGMMPYWRNLTRVLEGVNTNLKRVQERTAAIDRRMKDYEEIRDRTEKAERLLSSSSISRFVFSGLILFISVGGLLVNFNLIALPMSEMVGGGSYIGQFTSSDVMALAIVLIQVAMGVYLMEALGVTHLFPAIGCLDDRMRRKLIWAAFILLFTLAGLESILTFMGERMAADMEALQQSLSEAESLGPLDTRIATAGKMMMAFLLPFVSTFLAIPLEAFLQSSRIVFGIALALTMRGAAFSLRLLGGISESVGEVFIHVYDLLIIPPLWIERVLRERGEHAKIKTGEETP